MEFASGVPVLTRFAMRRWLAQIGLLVLALPGLQPISVCLADLSENQAKTSLLFNITKFTQWPRTAPDKTLNLCVYREDPITPTLSSLRDKTSMGRALRVQRVDTTDEALTCQMLFIGRGEQANLRPMTRALRGQAILVVSDIPDSAERGAVVEISLENQRIAFKINKAVADNADLKFSSQLLSLAKAVYTND